MKYEAISAIGNLATAIGVIIAVYEIRASRRATAVSNIEREIEWFYNSWYESLKLQVDEKQFTGGSSLLQLRSVPDWKHKPGMALFLIRIRFGLLYLIQLAEKIKTRSIGSANRKRLWEECWNVYTITCCDELSLLEQSKGQFSLLDGLHRHLGERLLELHREILNKLGHGDHGQWPTDNRNQAE